MPIIHIIVPDGSANETKKQLIEKVTAAMVDSGCGPADRIRVLVHQASCAGIGKSAVHLSVGGGSKGSAFPAALIFLIEGRTDKTKAEVAEKVAAALVEFGCGEADQSRIAIMEIPSAAWGIGGRSASDLGR